ncbi:MAG: hypothetical protein Q9187_002845 [Circinaria calcarea]
MLVSDNVVAASSAQVILPTPLLAPPLSPLDVSIRWYKAIESYCTFDFDASLSRHKRILRKLVSSSRANPSSAESASETAAENRVTRAKLWFNIGITFCFVGEYYLATEALRKCTEIDKDLVVGWYALGIAMFQMRKYRSSGQAFVRCMNTMDGLGIDRVEVDCFQMCDEVDHRTDDLSSEDSASFKLNKDKWTLGRLRVAWNARQAFFEKSHKAKKAFLPGKGKWSINGVPVGVLFGPEDVPVHSHEMAEKLADAKMLRLDSGLVAIEGIGVHEVESGLMRTKSLRQMTVDELKTYEVHDMKRTLSTGSDRKTKPLPPLPPPTPLNSTLFDSASHINVPGHRALPANAPVSDAALTNTQFINALHTNALLTSVPVTGNHLLNAPLTNTALTDSGPVKAQFANTAPTSTPPTSTRLTDLEKSEIRKMNLKMLKENMLRRTTAKADAAKADAAKADAPSTTQPGLQPVLRTAANPSPPVSGSVNLPSADYLSNRQALPPHILPFTAGISAYPANRVATLALSENVNLSLETDKDIMIRKAVAAGTAVNQPGRPPPFATDTSHKLPQPNTVNPMYTGNPSNSPAQLPRISPYTTNMGTNQANRAAAPLPLATFVNSTFHGNQPNRSAFTNKSTANPSPLRSSFIPSPPSYATVPLSSNETITPAIQNSRAMTDVVDPPLPPPEDPAWLPGKWQKRTTSTPVVTQSDWQKRRLDGREVITENPENAVELWFIPDIEEIESRDRQMAEMGSFDGFIESYLDTNARYDENAEYDENDTTPRASVLRPRGVLEDEDHEDHKRNQAAALRRLEGLPDLPTTPDTPPKATTFPPRRDSIPLHLRQPQSMQQHRQSPLGFHGLPILLPPGYNPDPNLVVTPGELFFFEQVELMEREKAEREKAQREALAKAAHKSTYEDSVDGADDESVLQYESDPEEDIKYESRHSRFFQGSPPRPTLFTGPSTRAQAQFIPSPPRRAPVPTARQRLEDEADSERAARTASSSPPLFLQPVTFEGFGPGKQRWNGWKGVE